MSEELIQKGYEEKGQQFGLYEFYNIGKTNINNLKKFIIIPNKDYGVYENKSPDALISDRRNKNNIDVICVIEHKSPDKFDNDEKRNKAFKQCNNYCQVLDAKIGIITDGNTCYWINPKINLKYADIRYIDKDIPVERGFSFIRNDNGTYYKTRFEPSNTESINNINLIIQTVSINNSCILKKNMISPSALAKQVWQSVWLATGDDPKKCLMTFTELFIFKFLSDLEILKIDENGNEVDFQSVFNKGKNHCLKYYLSVVRPYISNLFPISEDGTTIINGLSLKKDQNQDNMFYDILISFNDYGKLENIDPNFKSRLFETFLKGTTGKKQLAQFFTPRNVIKAMVELADVKNLPDNSKICDPACGVGGFIIESILNRKSNEKNDFYFKNNHLEANIQYHGYDYDDLTIVLAKSNLLITLTELLSENRKLTSEFSVLLGSIFKLENKSIIGSLEKIESNKFSLVMSNPPYVSKGMRLYREHIKNSGELAQFYSTPSVGKEGLFLQKIIQELNENGEAFVILPDGFFYRPADNELKQKILSLCLINCILSLPEKTFYATSKKTYILGLKRKPTNNKQGYPIFASIIVNIGESLDVDRIPNEENDLITAVREYKYYQVDQGNYKVNNKKIKLIDIDKFEHNLNWLIENYWSIDEKIELGLEEDTKDVTDDDIFDNIDYFKEQLAEIKSLLEKEFNFSSSLNKYRGIKFTDRHYFKIHSTTLGLTRKEYSKLDTKNINDIPLYTAASKPVAFIKEQKQKANGASQTKPHISLATDGDGTAGTNIFMHKNIYYLNTSRIAFELLDDNILPEYIYYFIQDVKKTYGYDFRHKANQANLQEIDILVPVDKDGNFNKELQRAFIEYYLKMEKIKKQMISSFFEKIGDFERDINNQLSAKIKEYFLE